MKHPTLAYVPTLLGLVSLALVSACGDDGSGAGYGYTSANPEQAEGDDTGAAAGGGDNGNTDGNGGEGGDGPSSETDPGEGGEGEDDDQSDEAEAGDGEGEPGDGDAGEDPPACQEFASDVAPIPPEVMFLLDRSGSMMGEGFDPNDPNKTRWQALYEAVASVVGDGADSSIAFGAKTFSTKGAGPCGVSPTPDVDIALDNAPLLLASIPGPLMAVTGGTPTNLAIETTMAHMASYASEGEKFIFLITDGRIKCTNNNDAQAVADAVTVLGEGLATHNITTYVVGIAAGGAAVAQLNAMAVAGGAAQAGEEKFYRADDADALSSALAQIVAESNANSCVLNLEEPPAFPKTTKVLVGGTAYGLVDDCEAEDGFIYTNEQHSQIRMCGLGCAAILAFKGGQVQYFCDPG